MTGTSVKSSRVFVEENGPQRIISVVRSDWKLLDLVLRRGDVSTSSNDK
jgi:hypothetical protein